MSVKNFKFVSPGVFINEIDNSQLPEEAPRMGPVIIGRTERGPALRPVRVDSFSEFVNVFGNPIPGGAGGDVWRDGNKTSATYAAYAAQAYLRNNRPVTMVRLLEDQAAACTVAGRAGWEVGDGNLPTYGNNESTIATGGSYGMYVFDSGSAVGAEISVTGTLAAVWYLNEGVVMLSGNAAGDQAANEPALSGTCTLVNSTGATREFTAVILDKDGTQVEKTAFNFNEASSKYIRKVFNTNPTLTNTTVTPAEAVKTYWLGESFERQVETFVTGTAAGLQWAFVAPLTQADGDPLNASYEFGLQASRSGWVISQDTAAADSNFTPISTARIKKLFRFHGLGVGTGVWDQKNLKISIQDIKSSTNLDNPYGSFSVVIRKAQDSDNAVRVVERFSNCNLNPNSMDYVGRKIGDKYVTWDDGTSTYQEFGKFHNQSKFIRVQVEESIDTGGGDAAHLPFGFWGPPKLKDMVLISGSAVITTAADGGKTDATDIASSVLFLAGNTIVSSSAPGPQRGDSSAYAGTVFIDKKPMGAGNAPVAITLCAKSPELPLRVTSIAGGLSDDRDAYWGLDTSTSGSGKRFSRSYADLVRAKCLNVDSFDVGSDATLQYQAFTLDNLVFDTANNSAYYLSGSRAATTSMTAVSGTFQEVLDMGYDRFTMPLYGGFNGNDVTEKDPFRNGRIAAAATATTNSVYYSIKRAIDTVADPEVVEMNVATVPGITAPALTSHLISTCEDRADCLAIIDLEGGFTQSAENNSAMSDRIGSVATTITTLKNRGLNSSYACAFYPWVQIRDSINNQLLFVPPSVIALGTLGSSAAKSEVWFAPAGFNRGGLTEGSAGVPVLDVVQKLTSKDRDKLYDANINPIASFPAEGIVIFGQKTLQVTPSALDRINVRRLLIYLKKEISRISANLLFDQNVQATWDRFLAQVRPFLASVKSRLGLMDYKVILDSATTTPDLIDRNIMYAKILLKPAKAIEFIALDFVITDSGASFED